ncbi:hypothetical protein [Lysinibacillus sp. FJAT-14222]|uniref:hypothetical protein n=1 Tax=Lysinibacillus sp. FJAT-14222 TaxID=1932366 RepID=UPI001160CC9E|nr:hypothetical protein [Lysinibacillus sp. FJAT-14222]
MANIFPFLTDCSVGLLECSCRFAFVAEQSFPRRDRRDPARSECFLCESVSANVAAATPAARRSPAAEIRAFKINRGG